MVNFLVLPHNLFFMYLGFAYIRDTYPKRAEFLKKSGRGLNPSWLEVVMAMFCFACWIF
jgi:hypothetical protein